MASSNSTANDNGEIFRYSQSLATRCMNVYGWSEEFCKQALLGYEQFMKLKLFQEDWNGTILSPSLVVDQVWYQHTLDYQEYAGACHVYTGGDLIDRNPDGAYDEDEKKQRIHNTTLCLKDTFQTGEINAQVWNFGNIDDNVMESQESRLCPEDTITVIIRDETGKVVLYTVGMSNKLCAVFDHYAAEIDTTTSNLRCRLRGLRVNPEQTFLDLDMKDGDILDVHTIMRITVIDPSGKWVRYKVKMHEVKELMKLGAMFDRYAARIGVTTSSLRFKLRGSTVSPEQTFLGLGMKDGDILDVDTIITISVRNSNCPDQQYKIMMSMKLECVCDNYAAMIGIPASSLQYSFGGCQVHPEQTFLDVGMKNGDILDVGMKNGDIITISVKDPTGQDVYYKITVWQKLGLVCDNYAARIGIPASSLQYSFRGLKVHPEQTYLDVGMKNGDILDVGMKDGDVQVLSELFQDSMCID